MFLTLSHDMGFSQQQQQQKKHNADEWKTKGMKRKKK